MTSGERTALLIGGLAFALGGAYVAGVEAGFLPNPFAPKPPPGTPIIVRWPQTFSQARRALVQLDVMWFQNRSNPALQTQLHQEAEAIRQAYPGAGPEGGYTCQQLVQMGQLSSSYCT
jgi:hypothetical protein